MRLDFLCPRHRRALLETPQRAVGVWLDCDRRLRDDTTLPGPTRLGLAGSALEAADIYLSALYLASGSPPAPSQRQSAPPALGAAPHPSPGTAEARLPAADRQVPDFPGDEAFILERYATSALRLMDMLCRAGQRRLALVVLAGANAMVEQVSRAGADVDAALRACRRLTRDGMSLLGNQETVRAPAPRAAAAVATLH